MSAMTSHLLTSCLRLSRQVLSSLTCEKKKLPVAGKVIEGTGCISAVTISSNYEEGNFKCKLGPTAAIHACFASTKR